MLRLIHATIDKQRDGLNIWLADKNTPSVFSCFGVMRPYASHRLIKYRKDLKLQEMERLRMWREGQVNDVNRLVKELETMSKAYNKRYQGMTREQMAKRSQEPEFKRISIDLKQKQREIELARAEVDRTDVIMAKVHEGLKKLDQRKRQLELAELTSETVDIADVLDMTEPEANPITSNAREQRAFAKMDAQNDALIEAAGGVLDPNQATDADTANALSLIFDVDAISSQFMASTENAQESIPAEKKTLKGKAKALVAAGKKKMSGAVRVNAAERAGGDLAYYTEDRIDDDEDEMYFVSEKSVAMHAMNGSASKSHHGKTGLDDL